MIAVAKFEKCMIRMRIKAALQVKKGRGELTGVAPYGMQLSGNGKTLESSPHEGATKEHLRQLRGSGLTIRAIQDCALRQGLVNRKGKPFTLRAIYNMVKDVRRESVSQGACSAVEVTVDNLVEERVTSGSVGSLAA